QSIGTKSTSSPSRVAMARQRLANWPVSKASTLSPGESVLASAASQAPVPEEGKTTTAPLVRKIRLMPAMADLASSANSGPRWSMVGRSMARRIRSGTLVGPGICRKCLPVRELITRVSCGGGANLPGRPRLSKAAAHALRARSAAVAGEIVHRRGDAFGPMRHLGKRQRHFHPGERAHQHQLVEPAEMADAEDFALHLSKPRAE